MHYKWIGAVFIVISCGGFGFLLTLMHKREEEALRQLAGILEFMVCELNYRMTPLPELCRQAGLQGKGVLKEIFLRLSEELDYQIAPDVAACMEKSLSSSETLPAKTRELLCMLGNLLGRFDLDGQIKGLQFVRECCLSAIQTLTADRDVRLRSYQTLGLCAGAALVILFI